MAVKTGNKKVNVGSFKKLIEPGSSLDMDEKDREDSQV